MSRPPLPPFTEETSDRERCAAAEDAWNTRDPARVVLDLHSLTAAGGIGSSFRSGREEIQAFPTRKWVRELDYRLMKELRTFAADRIAVRFS